MKNADRDRPDRFAAPFVRTAARRSGGLFRIETASGADPAFEAFMPPHDIADLDNLALVDRRPEQLVASLERPAVAGQVRRFDVYFLFGLFFVLHG